MGSEKAMFVFILRLFIQSPVLGLPDPIQDRIDKLGLACNITRDIETVITQFQKIYNAFAIIFTLVLTIYSAMSSSAATARKK